VKLDVRTHGVTEFKQLHPERTTIAFLVLSIGRIHEILLCTLNEIRGKRGSDRQNPVLNQLNVLRGPFATLGKSETAMRSAKNEVTLERRKA
jgi:hypothetical protein